MYDSFTQITSDKGYVLLRNDRTGKFHVVLVNKDGSQVFSTVPGDAPRGGGRWYAPNTSAGIVYVSGGYSRSYARRIFNLRVREAAEYEEALACCEGP